MSRHVGYEPIATVSEFQFRCFYAQKERPPHGGLSNSDQVFLIRRLRSSASSCETIPKALIQ